MKIEERDLKIRKQWYNFMITTACGYGPLLITYVLSWVFNNTNAINVIHYIACFALIGIGFSFRITYNAVADIKEKYNSSNNS